MPQPQRRVRADRLSYVDSAFGVFENLLNAGLIILEQPLIGGLEAHDKNRLRVRRAQQAPSLGKEHADPVDIDGFVGSLEMLSDARDDVELDLVGAIDANLGSRDRLG